MSFGRPGGFTETFKVSPPQRGSFPLDHDGGCVRVRTDPGECKNFMLSYMSCLKASGSDSGKCRVQAKAYLACRMDTGLMGRDDFVNLGLGDVGLGETAAAATETETAAATASTASDTTPKTSSTAPKAPPPMWTPEERI